MTGLILGVFVVFIGVVGALVLALTSTGQILIPGIISVWTSQENDATALSFEPNLTGMAATVVCLAGIYVAVALVRRRVSNNGQAAE
jgi:hypothetical protein